jgi:hypothetical protein
MSIDKSPPEGSIFVLSYTECDYYNESTAALVYVLKNGRLEPLLGVLDLPHGSYFNHYDSDNYDRAIAIVQAQGVDRVFTPQFNVAVEGFFGQKLGYTELTDIPNEAGEIECWFEFGTFMDDWDFIERLKQLQIQVIDVNPETKEIVE